MRNYAERSAASRNLWRTVLFTALVAIGIVCLPDFCRGFYNGVCSGMNTAIICGS